MGRQIPLIYMDKIEYKLIPALQINDALALIRRSFNDYLSSSYSELGAHNFMAAVNAPALKSDKPDNPNMFFGAYVNGVLAGVITIFNKSHIKFLFIDKPFAGQKLAAGLIKHVSLNYFIPAGITEVTVNSSPYAQGFYKKTGFAVMQPEQEQGGIRFIPMKLTLS